MLRLPGSANRKSSAERTLLAARAKLSTLLDQKKVDSSIHEEIERVEEMLRTAEEKLRTARQHYRVVPLKRVDDVDDSDDHSAQMINHQLSRVYTDCDHDVAHTNALARCRSKTGLRPARVSTEQLDLTLKEILHNSDALSYLEKAGTLDFDALAFASLPVVANLPIFVSFIWVEQKMHLVKDIEADNMIEDPVNFKRTLKHFLESIDRTYNNNPYHNGAHGADTLLTFEWFFQFEFMQEQASPLDHLMGLIAGAIHDVGHPGRNNLFQTKTMSELAIRYNDKSVLENMHVARAFEIMQADTDSNWLVQLRSDFQSDGQTGNLQQYMRRGLIDLVLATDPAKHGKQVKELAQIVEDDEGADESHKKVQELEEKLFILGTLLHASDISNTVKPTAISLKWTNVLLTEFWSQGDEERLLGQPVSPLCDREAGMLEVPKGQIGFINFVIEPLYRTIVTLIPETQEALDNLTKNKKFWQQQQSENKPFDQLFLTT